MKPRILLVAQASVFLASAVAGVLRGAEVPPYYVHKETWQETLLLSRESFGKFESSSGEKDENDNRLEHLRDQIEKDFPVQWDWTLQDHGADFHGWFAADSHTEIERGMIGRVLEELGPLAGTLGDNFEALCRTDAPPRDRRWLDLYVTACERRRANRLEPLLTRCQKIIFTRHYNLGGSHYAYTEGQSDAQNERHFHAGASLCILELDSAYGRVDSLLDDPDGVIRDPDLSWDGKRVLFAWKKSDRKDDYHLHEIDLETRQIRQLTSGQGFADYEAVYLPDGDILFNSTRCVQTVDCWWTEVSNLYRCDGDGNYLRRLSFDQVHTNFPTVMPDGKVVYTRWEYNDRGQVYPQPLFQMNSDGTRQTEFYGNNSWFPTTILHARGIPDTQKVMAILSGHHTRQAGTLAIIDPAKGRQEDSGIQEIAPLRQTRAVRVDRYGQDGPLFQYPYPFSETEFLVAYDPLGKAREPLRFKIYFMNIDGRRELLAADKRVSSSQPIPLVPRKKPEARPRRVDYRKKTGTYCVQDVYAGPGLEGVPRGAIKRIRVVALEYRAAGIRSNRNRGPAGGALVSTPVSIGNGSWDVKVVLGDARVHEDGSACFIVPARRPVYFQLLDARGHVAQTMRSWSTLQPGEFRSCVGCHESKNAAPPVGKASTLATLAGPQPLEPFYGPPRGFSFVREIQPILDRRCIRCHNLRPSDAPDGDRREKHEKTRAFSLLGTQTPEEKSGRKWSDSYLALTQADSSRGFLMGKPNRLVNWISTQSVPTLLAPYHAGSAKSELLTLLEEGHGGVEMSREEMDKLACWIDLLVPYCGDYLEASTWSDSEINTYKHFLDKRRRMERLELKNIEQLIRANAELETR